MNSSKIIIFALIIITLFTVILIFFQTRKTGNTNVMPQTNTGENTKIDLNSELNTFDCSIEGKVSEKIIDNILTSESESGCEIPITQCRGRVCTAPIEIIECGKTQKVCNMDILCSCQNK